MNWVFIILQVQLLTLTASSHQNSLRTLDYREEDGVSLVRGRRQLVATGVAIAAATALSNIESEVGDQLLKRETKRLDDTQVIYSLSESQEFFNVGVEVWLRLLTRDILLAYVIVHNVDSATRRQLDNEYAILGGMTMTALRSVLQGQGKSIIVKRKEGYRYLPASHRIQRMPDWLLLGFDIYLSKDSGNKPPSTMPSGAFLDQSRPPPAHQQQPFGNK